MNSGCSNLDLFYNPTVSGPNPIVIEVSGITVDYTEKGEKHTITGIPSLKNSKRAVVFRDKKTGKWMGRPITFPPVRKWMDLATLHIESRLRSAFGITDEKMRTVASARSWIASLMPLDDAWAWCRELEVKSRLCKPGEEEGAVITITRLT